jgi:chromosome partitioning protein
VRVTVGNLKGGVAKTTSAVHLALALSQKGRVLLVDADPQAASALDWSNVADDAWPSQVTVIPWALTDLAKRVSSIANDYDHVVIDTGGENDVILSQALLVTDQLLAPVAPSAIELRRLPATFDLAAKVDVISPVYGKVLLVKVRTGTRSSVEARQMLTELELPVMRSEIHLWEQYPNAFGSVPSNLGEYTEVLAELEEEMTTP